MKRYTLFLLLLTLALHGPFLRAQNDSTPRYDQRWEIAPGLFRVQQNGHFGVANANDSLLIPCRFDQVMVHGQLPYLKAIKGQKMGLYNSEGRQLLAPEYDQIWAFDQDRARVLKNGKMGMVNTRGQLVVPPIYEHLGNFENGRARAWLDGQQVFLDPNGRLAGTPLADAALSADSLAQNQTEQSQKSDSLKSDEGQGPAMEIGPARVEHHKKKKSSFEGHLSGFYLGINGYLDADNKDRLPQDYAFMETIPGKSIEVGIYPWQQSIRLIGPHVGLVTAAGIKFNNYRFDFDRITEVPEESRIWFPDILEDARISKSKLTTLQLTVPLAFEIQLPDSKGKNNFYLSAGIEGGLRLRSHTKLVLREDGSKDKKKRRDSFGMPTFRYGYFAKAGYDDFGIYASYSPQSLFKEDRGPELFPYTIGITFNFN